MYTAYTCSFFTLPKPFLHIYVYNVHVPLMYIVLNVHIVGDLKTFFTDVVLPRTSGSPSLSGMRTKRTGSTGSNKGSRARSQSERHYPPDHRGDCEPITTCCSCDLSCDLSCETVSPSQRVVCVFECLCSTSTWKLYLSLSLSHTHSLSLSLCALQMGGSIRWTFSTLRTERRCDCRSLASSSLDQTPISVSRNCAIADNVVLLSTIVVLWFGRGEVYVNYGDTRPQYPVEGVKISLRFRHKYFGIRVAGFLHPLCV